MTAEFARGKNWNCLVAVCDDFVLSGTRMRGFAGRIFDELLKNGVDPTRAQEIVEANVVAISGVFIGRTISLGIEDTCTKRPLRIFSYYFSPEYRDSVGRWVFFPGVSLTGSHSSVDYGFEEAIRELMERFPYLDCPPPLCELKRPYETENRGRRYRDPSLQSLWENLSTSYSLE